MRKAITLGLLGLALIPLSLDRQSEAKNTTAGTVAYHLGADDVAFQVLSIMRAAKNDDGLRLAIADVSKDREWAATETGKPTPFSTIETASIRKETTETASFAAERNAEIRRSLAAYEAARDARKLDALTREIVASLEHAKTRREATFAAARNAEIRRSMAAYETARDIRFAEARNREIAASSARSARERTLAFAAARNAEARRSMASYDGARRELMAEAYQREIALVAARYAEREIALARANGDSIFATLARIAPHIGASNLVAQRTMRTNPIETASIGEKTIIGPCATPSP